MTYSQLSPSEQAALHVTQQAVAILAGIEPPSEIQNQEVSEAVKRAKTLLGWPEDTSLNPLPLLFDQVQLSQSQLNEFQPAEKHYWPAIYIEGNNPQIHYPRTEKPSQEDIDALQRQIKQSLTREGLGHIETCNNLSLLTLILEKFGSYISFGKSDVAVVDMARTTGALAAALVNNHQAPELSLIAGDLSGIQKFIYTISSEGALKSLRARSFYLELVTEEVVQQLLEKLGLPRINVIYAGGGNLYLLAPATDDINENVEDVLHRVNEWLLNQFQGKVFLALVCSTFPTEEVKTEKFADHWSQVNQPLAKQKSRKFASQIGLVLEQKPSHAPCKVCHRDDLEKLEPLNGPGSVDACPTCRQMFRLGGRLLKVEAIMRSYQENISSAAAEKLCFKIKPTPVYYHIFNRLERVESVGDSETVFLVNDWMIHNYRSGNRVSLLLGNYAKESEEEQGTTIRAGEMVEKAKEVGAIPRVGYLRMDVDRLGQIFAKGLGKNQTLPRLAGLSRQMSYFFKVYLNSLANNREHNLLKACTSVKLLENAKFLTTSERKNLLFIYAGGDDLFVSGAWNEVVEFAFDVYQCFRAYTGRNPDITLSGGISIDDVKFPLYQAAGESGEAEEAAKGNGRDSLGLFGQVFKWDEWVGIKEKTIDAIQPEIKSYLSLEALPQLIGIFPFVEQLHNKVEINHSRSFVRNLLLTAQVQEQMMKKIKDQPSEQQREVRYYLHLPKIAYTLARLPSKVREHPDFENVRTSLKNPYNAPYFRAIATWLELLNRS